MTRENALSSNLLIGAHASQFDVRQHMFDIFAKRKERRLMELRQLLAEASSHLRSVSSDGRWADWFDNPQALATEIDKILLEIETGDMKNVASLKAYFAPTSAWDDLSGGAGVALGNNVCEALSKI